MSRIPRQSLIANISTDDLLVRDFVDGLRAMNPHGGINELQAIGHDRLVVSGYFDGLETMARETGVAR